MGNNHSIADSQMNAKKSANCKWSKYVSKKHVNTCTDNFIIKHKQNNAHIDQMIDIHSLDQRRHIFVSLISLFQTWKSIPSMILYSSIFIVPLKSEWIYKPVQYNDEIKSHFISKTSLFQDQKATKELIELLKWKDSQGLVLWMLNDYQSESKQFDMKTDCELSVAPFWNYVSNFLTKLYDPITKNYYKPMLLNEKTWIDKKNDYNKYETNTTKILNEIRHLTMKFGAIQEILTQSNPTLNVVKMYQSDLKKPKTMLTNSTNNDENINGNIENELETPDIFDENEEWYVSDAYDPYDLDDGPYGICNTMH